MSSSHQVFQTTTPKRWKSFLWVIRLLVFFIVISLVVIGLSVFRHETTILPKIISQNTLYKKLLKADMAAKPKRLGKSIFDSTKKLTATFNYASKGRIDYNGDEGVRSAFYVNWDAQSFTSLQNHIHQVNIIFPEWIFISPNGDSISVNIEQQALDLMQQNKVKILPMLSNYLEDNGWNSSAVHKLLSSPKNRSKVIDLLIQTLEQYHLQGINIDLEELHENTDETLISFMQELYTKFHAKNLLVSQDVAALNEDYNLKELSKYNDYMILMAYDEHFSTSSVGPVASQDWLETVLQDFTEKVPAQKAILGLGTYGYDWSKGYEAETISYEEGLSTAEEAEATVVFDTNSYNSHFSYTDDNDLKHEVWFTDAATTFNAIRTAEDYGVAGTAIWRLGTEDERMWQFYTNDLSENAMRSKPFDIQKLQTILPTSKPDFSGEGEVLNLVTAPQDGKIALKYDSAENLIADQSYQKMPSGYVIKKIGKAGPKQIILTFDDGPDEEWTPKILDILEQEKVPAAFFVVGQNAENNIPLLKRIYDDGFEIGNHTFTHPNIADVNELRAKAEINGTQQLIESLTGHSTILFRPPYNADAEPQTISELLPIQLARNEGLITVGESIDPLDWEKGVSPDSIYNRIIAQKDLGNIILLHDAGGNRSATVAALPRIISYFRSQGYEFITLAKLMGKTKNDLMPELPKSHVRSFNYWTLLTVYWGEHILYSLFLLTIILSILRTVWVAVLAYRQKRKAKKETDFNTDTPQVSVIVPAYNEEVNVIKTITNLLAGNYPNMAIVVVDDGSKDRTYELVSKAFEGNPNVTVLTKPNGGKASALNFGIQQIKSDYVICIDADTQLLPNAISELMKYFTSPDVAAVAGNVKVGNERNLITRWQAIEYITSQNFDRRAMDLLNCITVVPGAIGAFRTQAIIEAGGFTTDTLAEDCDLTIRMLRNQQRIRYCNRAIAVTEAPETVNMFMKQRFRWTFGIMQCWWKHRETAFNPRYRWLGMFAMPMMLVFQLMMPLLSPLADLYLLYSLVTGNALLHILGFWLLFTLVDMAGAVLAFAFEGESIGRLIWLIPQRIIYRQFLYFILIKAYIAALKGQLRGWGTLKRTGNVQITEIKQ